MKRCWLFWLHCTARLFHFFREQYVIDWNSSDTVFRSKLILQPLVDISCCYNAMYPSDNGLSPLLGIHRSSEVILGRGGFSTHIQARYLATFASDSEY